MICNQDDENPYQRRSVVRFNDAVEVVVMDGSSTNDYSNNKDYEDYDDDYYDTIDIEAPAVVAPPKDEPVYDSTEDVVIVTSSDEESVDSHDIDEVENDHDSSDSEGSKQDYTTSNDWISYLHRSYGFIMFLMASGGGMLTSIVSYLCPSKTQVSEDDVLAATSMMNGDKAFLFAGSDGGSSYITYVHLRSCSSSTTSIWINISTNTSSLLLLHHWT